MANVKKRERAQELRRQGKSIGKIADFLGAPKSTVSFWCRDISLTTKQLKNLKVSGREKSIKALLKHAEKQRSERIEKSKQYTQLGIKDIGKLTKRDLFTLGLGLYWGEGYKHGNDEIGFTNKDAASVKLMLTWFQEIYHIKREDFILRVGINQIHKQRVKQVENWWSKTTGIPLKQFTKPSVIKSQQKKVYRNTDEHYGTLRIKVRRGTTLKARILGSIKACSQTTTLQIKHSETPGKPPRKDRLPAVPPFR